MAENAAPAPTGGMTDELKVRLSELKLTAEQIAALEGEGAATADDMLGLIAEQIKAITGCGMVTANNVARSFAAPAAPAPVAAPTSAPEVEIPEGKSPTPAQVHSFANNLGIDGSALMSYLVVSNIAAGSGGGMDLDFSGMIPVPAVVAGYNPKIRDMSLMVMGSIERQLGVPIVVIDDTGAVNRDLTVEYIMGLQEGREPVEDNIYFDGDGTPHEVIAVGVDAQSIEDADPLMPTKALQKNGMGTGRIAWKGVPLEVRQVVYYAVQLGEINPANEADLTWLRDRISAKSRRLDFTGKAPKANSAFNEAARSGALPTLRVMLARSPRRKEIMPRRRTATPRDLTGVGRTFSDDDKF